MRKQLFFSIGIIAIVSGCGGGGSGGEETPPAGMLSVMVVDADSVDIETPTIIEGALVDIYDVTGNVVYRGASDADGAFSYSLDPGTYTMRITAQGFQASPPQGVEAVPFQIVDDQTYSPTIILNTHPSSTATSQISGNADVSNMLIVAVDSTNNNSVSAISDDSGNYTLFNLEPGTYTVTSYQAGYSSDSIDVIVESDAILETQDLEVIESANVTLSGSVTFLAAENGIVDITLRHPDTRDVIPGLSVENSASNEYTMVGVPAGNYLAWASLRNDGYVMDQDWVIKNGGEEAALSIQVGTTDLTKDFSITDTVAITSPTNDADQVIPVEVETLTPTFTWQAYPATAYWALEVFDNEGNTIWGGFDGVSTVAHGVIGKDTLTAEFNFDGSASEALQDGQIYRWRVMALKDGTGADAGTYIVESASEDQLGVFKVVLPEAP